MGVDIKNITRLDLKDIFKNIKRQCAYNLASDGPEEERFIISDNDMEQLWEFFIEGCSLIATEGKMAKHHFQTGLDAITFYDELENPLLYDTNEDGIITGPDGDDVNIENIGNRNHFAGQKLANSNPDYILVSIDNVEDDQLRYTIVQQFIKSALISYVLMKWWMMVGKMHLAQPHQMSYEVYLTKIKENSISNQKIIKSRIPLRPSMI